jgi:outer membrane protein OmpA-like peptidoglycan-associated protein
MPRQTLRRIGITILGYIGIEPHIPVVERKYNAGPLGMITVLKAFTGLPKPEYDDHTTVGGKSMFSKCLLIAATALSLPLSGAMAAGEQLQLIQDAEQLKTALAGEPVVLTPQLVSVTVTSSSDKMFPSGDWQLPTSSPLLDKMIPTLSKFHTTKIVVRGYTDNVPIGQPLQTAGVTDNFDLSGRRAMSVVRYLVAHGVNADILSAQAFGAANPVAPNDTPDGQAKNRRVEIVLIGDGSLVTASSTPSGASEEVTASSKPSGASADEGTARSLLKAMSDYMGTQTAISFSFDTNLEIVTKDAQKLDLASSGTVILNRPDKLRVTRHGGFADAEAVFDGKTLSLLGKNANVYGQVDVPGSIDNLIDVLRDKYNRPVPGADLLQSDFYDELLPLVVDVKDLGSGVIGGVECDHLAFRTEEVDWQIWIAQGARPYPCRYVITSKHVTAGPQYSIQVKDWKTGNEVASDNFSFTNATNARKLELKDLDTDELPSIFRIGRK